MADLFILFFILGGEGSNLTGRRLMMTTEAVASAAAGAEAAAMAAVAAMLATSVIR